MKTHVKISRFFYVRQNTHGNSLLALLKHVEKNVGKNHKHKEI